MIEEVPKLHRESKKLPDCSSRAEVVAMLAGAHGWLRVPVGLAAYAGFRMGEVRALEVRDVDLDAGVIRVRRSLSENEVTTPKSGRDRSRSPPRSVRAWLTPSGTSSLERGSS